MKRIIFLLYFFVLRASAFAEPMPEATATDDKSFHWSDLLPRPLQKNPRILVSVLTTMTDEGKKRKPASAENPVFYDLLDGGQAIESGLAANERPPTPAALQAILKKSLTTAGLQPQRSDQIANVLIFYRWGSYNQQTSIGAIPGNVDVDLLDMNDPAQVENLSKRAQIVGGPEFAGKMLLAMRRGTLDAFQLTDARTDSLVEMAMGNLYYLIAVAFDAPAAVTGKKVELWSTTISTNSVGLVMADTLPTLVTRSAKYFGHETNGSVLYDSRLLPGHVEVGESTVVEGRATPERKK